ncbi:MAG: aminopeptidase N, partial [Gammaproteobacteria bacterium]|nr:aminopeptidase N [Gammaproteobacteria bacterium]
MQSDAPQTVYLKEYTPPPFLIDRTELHFELAEGEALVAARLSIRRNPDASATTGSLLLHGEELEPLEIAIDGRPLGDAEYSIDAQGLHIAQPPERFTLESRVRILPQENTALEGLYKSGAMFCTQCEAEGFRKITWFLDRPDVMSRFVTTIVADAERYPVLLSNG